MMGLYRLLVCLPLLAVGGCSWFPYFVGNIVGTPVEAVECCCLHMQAWKLANRAWQEVSDQQPNQAFSAAYAHGFRHGFSDSVERNGIPEPPATPPCWYRYPALRTPEQQQKIEDWYAGFRHGAQVAQEQRWREGVIVPIARPPITNVLTFKQEFVPVPQAPVPPLEELPLPHKGPPGPEVENPFPLKPNPPVMPPIDPPLSMPRRMPSGATACFDPDRPLVPVSEAALGRPPAVPCGSATAAPRSIQPVSQAAFIRSDIDRPRMPAADETRAPSSLIFDFPARPNRPWMWE
jgi:hypothetical protein